jgi:hypothetical protein
VDGRRERLDYEHIRLATIGPKLNLKAVIAVPAHAHPAGWHTESIADFDCKVRMRAAAKDNDFSHAVLLLNLM